MSTAWLQLLMIKVIVIISIKSEDRGVRQEWHGLNGQPSNINDLKKNCEVNFHHAKFE